MPELRSEVLTKRPMLMEVGCELTTSRAYVDAVLVIAWCVSILDECFDCKVSTSRCTSLLRENPHCDRLAFNQAMFHQW